MDSNPSPGELSSDFNFTFAFNDRNFSDRILKIEYLLDFPASNHGGEVQRRRNVETTKDADNGDESVHRVETVHVSSLILAAKSSFFYKLFTRESNKKEATLQILVSEEAAFMALMNFMYGGDLATTTATDDILKVLIVADKFKVVSCMKYCSLLLCNFPMTRESALCYLGLPSSVSMVDAIQSLTDAAKQFLASHYKDLTKFHEEVLNLPLHGIEAVLSSDDLQVPSEDDVFDFLLKWANKHHPLLEDRRQVFGSHLIQLIRFPYMTCHRLRNILTCTDFQTELVSEAVISALLFKADTEYRHRSLATKASGFTPRAYRIHPVKVIELEFPLPHCIVYLDLKREKCLQLFPFGRIFSEAFIFGGRGFYLDVGCMTRHSSGNKDKFLGVALGMMKHENEPVLSCTVEYEFSTGTKVSDEYARELKATCMFNAEEHLIFWDSFGVPWSELMHENSAYFVNDSLHIRAKIALKQ